MRLERGFAAASSHISYKVEDLLAVGNKVVLIVDGRIAESGDELDLMGLFRQLRSP